MIKLTDEGYIDEDNTNRVSSATVAADSMGLQEYTMHEREGAQV